MACFKLTSCTASNTTVIYTNTNLVAYVGLSIEIAAFPGVCFTVETSDPPCNCDSPIPVVVTLPDCICNAEYSCYLLSECNNLIPPFYVSTNLNPYVGLTISVAEYPGYCFNVVGIINPATCAANLPIPVTCAFPCTCGPVIYCYELTNCLNPAEIITVNSTLILTVGNVIAPTPSIIPPGGNNCWTVTDDSITPCNAGTGTTITAAIDYGVGGCALCAGPPPCYQLVSCDGLTTIYTQSDLSAYAGGPPIATTVYPGQCWIITLAVGPCEFPVVIDPLTVSYCNCPCYTLTNCVTQEVINSNSNLAAYVGQSVHLDEYGGCAGDCWLVAINPGACNLPVTVTVTLGCVPCGPCSETCYELVDCETDVVFLTVLNPTVNGIDLGTLVTGQAIGHVTSGGLDYFGCWYVRLATDCATAVDASVFSIYPGGNGQTGCEECLNSCYALLNCKTLTVDYIIKYTIPNPYSLPNPSTLSGAIGSLCFEDPTGCVSGCYQLQLIPGASCVGSVDWSTVVSYTPYQDCFECEPPCYLLTECAPAVSDPIVVNNDLSLYVGQVAKICDSQGVCHCYHVELAQSCDNSITIDNANAAFITCEECNSCDCPPGYTRLDDICQKITSLPATLNPRSYSTEASSVDVLYGNLGTNFYGNISALPFPLTAVGVQFQDASTAVVPSVNNSIGVWGGPAGSRLNTVGIWTTSSPNPTNEWIGFTECIIDTLDGIYSIGIGGNESVRVKVDGVVVILASAGAFDFNYWHVFEISLTAGTHIITIEGMHASAVNPALGAEIYNTTAAILQTYTTAAQVQLVTIFSTFSYRAGGTFQTGESSGYSCPPGYTLDDCNGSPSCSLIETIPFVPCAPTYLVTDCTGSQVPFYTNTDLSGYLSGTYKTCIPSITYSADCFILKDCNRLAPDIVTNTDLSIYIWQVVLVEGYPGSCFIVTGVPVGDPCVNPVPVVAAPPVMGICDCQGAQQPWPAGCYCVTVQQVIPPVVATDFTGVFGQEYGCCEDCTQTCYLLTACTGSIDPVVICRDLSQYVNKVIKITGCGDICWQVAVAIDCTNSQTFGGAITEYEDCVTCLPPVPPPPPPYDLHLRKIRPGYNSPNSCYTTEYIERINCTFAEQVYNQMAVDRFGITMCCDEDINTWDIKKQLMDLDLLKDPSMCKSTLCCCPAPCLIDVVITVLPFCGAPVIVSVDLVLPCPAPVIIDTEITVEVIPSPCYCFSVETLEEPMTISYIDCCCIVQSQVLDTIGVYPICAATTPVALSNPSGIIVTNLGLCNQTPLCTPPPPQVCSCWKISNTGIVPGSYSVDEVCPSGPFPLGTAGVIVPGSPDVYVCSVVPPSVTNLVITNMGPCDNYCGPIPPACVCYEIEIFDEIPGCTFDYIDCDGNPVTGYLPVLGKNYVCGQTMPVSPCIPVMGNPPIYTISTTPFVCVGGDCGPPFPCDCYQVRITDIFGFDHGFSYYDCNGLWQSVSLPDGTYYYCGSNFNTYLDPAVTVTPAPGLCVGC